MKKLIILAMILMMSACVTSLNSDKYSEAKQRVPEVREYLIKNLEISDAGEKSFINRTIPEMREVNEILYYWFKDGSGKAVFTVQTQPGKNFYIFEAIRN